MGDELPEPDEFTAAEGELLEAGHQVVGRVLDVGADVDGWSEGERAGAFWLASSCGICEACAAERENLCPEARFTGWDVDGGYATRMNVLADFALRLPLARPASSRL